MQKHCQTQNYVQNHINITELSLCEPLLLLCVYAPLPPWHGRRLRGCKGGGAAPCALGLALHLPQFHIKFENCGVPLPVTILLRCIKVSQSHTALHGMQTRFSDENSVRRSVRLSVRPSVKRVDCDKTEERSVQIFIPHQRAFSLQVF